jgi:transglutaminase-like putative cysteine protease
MASALSDAGQHLEQALFAIEPFRRSTAVIDWQHPDIVAKASALRGTDASVTSIARRCFEWVRDEIKHSHDHGLHPVTCVASDVLRVGSGYCYAKSHLLAALLRANGLSAGFCYQRLSRDDNGPPSCLHGLNAVWLSAHERGPTTPPRRGRADRWFRDDAYSCSNGSAAVSATAAVRPGDSLLAIEVQDWIRARKAERGVAGQNND